MKAISEEQEEAGPSDDDWISYAYESTARQSSLSEIIMDKIRFESGLPGSQA